MLPDPEASVLVVEDNPTNQLAIRALLDRFGVTADFVDSGSRAVTAVQTRRYRLVLMDLMMPGVDGYTATRLIRKHEYGSGWHTPIVAVTAVDPALSRGRSIDVGMDDFLGKPIELEALGEVLKRWLSPALPHASKEPHAGHAEEILESFLQVTGRLLDDLKSAIQSQDPTAASHFAHEVKASSLVMSASEMANLARQLEQAIREEKWSEVLNDYRDLVESFRRTTEYLHRPVRVILEYHNRKSGSR